jgi:hypothetical protein
LTAAAQIADRVRGLKWAARNLAMDLRFGGSLAGTLPARAPGTADVVNSQYSVLPYVFADRVRSRDVLVDVGCGKARVINWWLSEGLRNRMIGIEHNSEVASATARRLRRFGNVTIVNEDATSWMPDDATIGYMYSPFGLEIMGRFKQRIAERDTGRRFELLYWNPSSSRSSSAIRASIQRCSIFRPNWIRASAACTGASRSSGCRPE